MEDLKSVEKFILDRWDEFLFKSTVTLIDSKTKLQEFSLKKFKELPKYVFFKKLGLNIDRYLKQKFKYLIRKKLLVLAHQRKMHNKMLQKTFKNFKNMIWEDECYLLSKRKFRENANIINIFTQKKGKIDGIVYGGTSRKIKNYLQISNKLFVSHTSKSENRIGYFKTELIKPISPLYFNDKQRTSALISICSLLNILLPDYQPNKKIYNSFEKLINSINSE